MNISITKRLLTALIVLVFILSIANAQAPQKMSFQSVVRNSSGVLVSNHSVGVKISILQGSISGTAVYVETQSATSNANGLVTLQIGGGTVVSGTFSSIDWSAGPYYIKSEIDPTGGTSYGVVGTTQLLSVAYALYANSAGSASNGGFCNFKVFSTAGTFTWTPPIGVSKIMLEGWGGGAGGNGFIVGGQGGAYGKGIYNVNSNYTYSVNVGAGGIGSNSSNIPGGNTSFDTLMIVSGGGNCCTNSPINLLGSSSVSFAEMQDGNLSGGDSPIGGYGGRFGTNYGYNGNQPGGGGGGGGGGYKGYNGGNGASGRLIIWW